MSLRSFTKTESRERGTIEMHTRTSPHSKHRRWARCVGGGATALVALAAVVSPAGAATKSNRPIGASGDVAALSGSTMEVQNASSGQTTVSWTSTTTFSKTVSEAVGALAEGDCISVTGTASKKSKTKISARSISVTTPTSNGSCTGPGTRRTANRVSGGPQGGRFAPPRGGGFEGSRTNGRPPNFPSGGSGSRNFRKQLASLSVATGKVTAVKGSELTVSGITLSPGSFPVRRSTSSNSHKKSKKPTRPKTEKLTITTSSRTTVNATQSASSGDLAVGDCVSAFGPAASNGAVSATTVRITSTGGASCTATAGFPGGGFPGGPGGPGSSSA